MDILLENLCSPLLSFEDYLTKLCKQLVGTASTQLSQTGNDAHIQAPVETHDQHGNGGFDTTPPGVGGSDTTPSGFGGLETTPPASSASSAMSPAAGDLSLTLPTSVAALNVRPEGAGGLDDVRHEGAGGLDDTVPSLCASVRSVAVAENLSLHDANVKVLNLTFGRADLQPDPDLMMDTLLANSVKTKVKGQIFREPGRQFRYVRDDKLVFSSNHGRNRCSRRKCSSLADVPHNCLLHPQWPLPNGFKFCGHNCQGAFCYCLKYS